MIKKALLIIFLLILSAAALGFLYLWNQVNIPVSKDKGELLFMIPSGVGVKEIAAQLEQGGYIRSQFWFEAYVYLKRSGSKFIAGNYLLERDMSMRDVVRVLTSNTQAPEEWIKITEGWTAKEIAVYLESLGIVNQSEFLSASAQTDISTLIPEKQYAVLADKPSSMGLEGYLFPDSYRVFKDATAADIIERMLDNMEVKFTAEMYNAARTGDMSVFQIITLASILEKEVRSYEDRQIAAGIFYSRMNQGIPLQSDATVNYITGKNTIQPSRDDTEVDNPYNTYQNRGLPPGPICNPSLDAIQAALNPEKTDYLYFLTKPDGTTVFSKTYDEHLLNKQKYLQ
ncbi:MAG: endolytic transglycosylase MltG [Patescibacteria group bacterium]|nr:endolytic transglycosylase MltG [Patescibacteria group bacterium]MDD5715239.1 endolytic transglycosylase MltG [Patescibacteria group bacterium]